MSDLYTAIEQVYLSYEAELAATQANINRCQDEANQHRDHYTALLNDRAEAIKNLTREAGQ